MARPRITVADTKAIRKLYEANGEIVDIRPIIATTMHYCGTTYREIGESLGMTKQQALNKVDNTKAITKEN